jgi:hypothetical protein
VAERSVEWKPIAKATIISLVVADGGRISRLNIISCGGCSTEFAVACRRHPNSPHYKSQLVGSDWLLKLLVHQRDACILVGQEFNYSCPQRSDRSIVLGAPTAGRLRRAPCTI